MFEHIIVPLDGTRGSEQAVPIAARLARCMGARAVLLRAIPPPGAGEAELEANLARPSELAAQRAERSLQRIAARFAQAGIAAGCVVEREPAAGAIVAAAERYPAALVVMRSRNRGGRLRLGLGSVAGEVVREAPAPVLILPYGRQALPAPSPFEPLPQSPLRILVPLDGSPLAEAALGPAAELLEALALPGKGEILLLRVVPPFAADAQEQHDAAAVYLTDVARRLRARLPADARQTVRSAVVFETEVPHALIRVSLNGLEPNGPGFDLVVMTTHGQGGLQRHILGGVAEQVLYQTRLPVLVVSPEAAMEQRAGGRADERAEGWTGEHNDLDPVFLGSLQSFPASDPPGWLPHRT
jgi:nucleotide-binding universal stress UspA family protein